MKTIAVDVDGVCADIHTEWLRLYNRDYNDTLAIQNITDWDMTKFVKSECGIKIYEYLEDPTLYDNILPLPDARRRIGTLKAFGYRVIYATASPVKSYGRKFEWLKQYDFIQNGNDYIETKDKGLIKADILIDDYPENFNSFVGRKIIFSRPWNLHDNRPDCFRVDTWNGVVNLCQDWIQE